MRRDQIIICKPFLAFVKAQHCLVAGHSVTMDDYCGAWTIDPHHLIARGQRECKRNDLTAVNLCRKHHSEVGQGKEKFEAKYGIDLWKENAFLQQEFFTDPTRVVVSDIVDNGTIVITTMIVESRNGL